MVKINTSSPDDLNTLSASLALEKKGKKKIEKELIILQKKLTLLQEEKSIRSIELGIANKELQFQDREKEKRASELGIANIELAYQDDEKGKRASELAIANIELIYQNIEKEKRNFVNTELQASVKLLETASQYARSLLEASLDPLVTISAEGKITDVNEASVDVTGISREQLIGSDFSRYFTDSQKAQDGYEKVFKKGFISDYPLTIKNINGKLTDVLYNASVYRDTKGKILGVFAAARDITIQKLLSNYSRSLLEASRDPLFVINRKGKITDLNNACAKITHLTREKLIGSSFTTYFTEPEKARQGYKKVFSDGFVEDFSADDQRRQIDTRIV